MTPEQFTTICVYLLTGIVGLCVGSFLNVVIYRVPNGMSLGNPPSHCPKCNYKLRWYDNIPVISYIILGGKCRSCHEHISFRYTIVELANMILWLLSALLFWEQSLVYALVAMAVSSLMLVVFFVDLENMIILDRTWIALAVLAIPAMFFESGCEFYDNFIGLGVALGMFLLVYFGAYLVYKKEALGIGDIKFASAAGLFLGWQKFFIAIVFASIVGSVVMLIIRAVRKDAKDTEYPFGPYLASGVAVAMFFGEQFINWYLGLLLI